MYAWKCRRFLDFLQVRAYLFPEMRLMFLEEYKHDSTAFWKHCLLLLESSQPQLVRCRDGIPQKPLQTPGTPTSNSLFWIPYNVWSLEWPLGWVRDPQLNASVISPWFWLIGLLILVFSDLCITFEMCLVKTIVISFKHWSIPTKNCCIFQVSITETLSVLIEKQSLKRKKVLSNLLNLMQ